MNEPFERSFEGELVGRQASHYSRAVLTTRQREEVRQRLAEADEVTPDLVRGLALEYGVSTSTIRRLAP